MDSLAGALPEQLALQVPLGVAVVASLLAAGVACGLLHWLSRHRAWDLVADVTTGLRAENDELRGLEHVLRTREADLAAFTEEAASRLQTPLADVTAALETAGAAVGRGSTDTGLALLAEVQDRCLDLSRLVGQLLLYSSVSDTTLRMRQVDLLPLTLEAVRRLESTHPGAGDLVDVDPLPEVLGDAALLSEVVERLVENALTHVEPGSRPRVHVTAALADTSWHGEQWRVEVRDRGRGIPDADRARVFEALRRPDAPRQPGRVAGNHLSLALCRRIVLRHGGDIGVAPNPGGGTVAWFTLPVRVDRRTSERVPLDEGVTVRSPTGVWRGRLVDISEGGARAEFAAPPALPVGTAVDVDVELANRVHHERGTVLPRPSDLPANQVNLRFAEVGPELAARLRSLAVREAGIAAAGVMPAAAESAGTWRPDRPTAADSAAAQVRVAQVPVSRAPVDETRDPGGPPRAPVPHAAAGAAHLAAVPAHRVPEPLRTGATRHLTEAAPPPVAHAPTQAGPAEGVPQP